MPVRTAFLLGSLNRGGAETLLLDCFKNASYAGFSFIGIYRKEGALSEAFQSTGVPLFQIAPESRTDLGYLFRLRKLLVRNGITIVHAQQPIDAIYAKLACIGTNIKIVLTFHGYDQDCSLIEKRLIRWCIGKTDLNIFVSQHQKKAYAKYYPVSSSNHAVVYNGIDFRKMVSNPHTNWRKQLHIDDSVLILGSVGNFSAVRDQITICHFLKLLAEKQIDFRFLFAGKEHTGEEWRYEQCVNYCRENNLSDKVLFAGSRSDIPDMLSQLDAFVYASDHDSFGIAVIEAIASAIPVFVNDWEVMQEVTSQGKYAHLYQTKNTSDLLEQFSHFIAQRESMQAEAREAAIRAKEQFGIQQHLEHLTDVYQALISKG